MDRPPLQAPLLALDCAVRPHSPGLQQLPRSPRGTQWPQGSSVTDCAADSLSVALPAASRMATMFPNRTKMLPNFQAISRVPFPESGVRHSCMSHCPPRHARYHATPSLKERPRSFASKAADVARFMAASNGISRQHPVCRTFRVRNQIPGSRCPMLSRLH